MINFSKNKGRTSQERLVEKPTFTIKEALEREAELLKDDNIAFSENSWRDIEEDEELNFDYKFDSFRTPLTKCLCGTNNCKGYLGVIPTNYTIEEWEEQLDNMPCSICEQNIKDDDDKLVFKG